MRIDIPHIDPTLWQRLKIEAKHRGLEISDLMIEALSQFLGLEEGAKRPASNPADLHHLAGTWTEKEADEFKQNTAIFDKIDDEIWK